MKRKRQRKTYEKRKQSVRRDDANIYNTNCVECNIEIVSALATSTAERQEPSRSRTERKMNRSSRVSLVIIVTIHESVAIEIAENHLVVRKKPVSPKRVWW
jgi:hypothetical protein